eukprot:TRINITY_DN6698_c0_g1_i1.p1 TRINITY_DN6698_c0_g1~~TRINITY_DN6698_c0_g1_i1.p1  ORF type:complete len:408 (-),score=78.51 TRINITY_DN6698_c0_g1_i1:130-1353(-)
MFGIPAQRSGPLLTVDEFDTKAPDIGNTPLGDVVTGLNWSPANSAQGINLFATTSYDKHVRVYRVQKQANVQRGAPIVEPVRDILYGDLPPFDCCISPDLTVFACGADRRAYYWSLQQAGSPATAFASHNGPIRCVRRIEPLGLTLTAGWDNQLALWDMRQPNPVRVQDCGEPVLDVDVMDSFVAVCLSRRVMYTDLATNHLNPFSFTDPHSRVRHQLRCIRLFRASPLPNYAQLGAGFALGASEGRVAIMFFSELDRLRRADELRRQNPRHEAPRDLHSFSFRCHRDETPVQPVAHGQKHGEAVHPVHDMSFHPVHNTFITAGGNGQMGTWDHLRRMRIEQFPKDRLRLAAPVVRARYDSTGEFLAYAMSYDWRYGAAGMQECQHRQVNVRTVSRDDVVAPPPQQR